MEETVKSGVRVAAWLSFAVTLALMKGIARQVAWCSTEAEHDLTLITEPRTYGKWYSLTQMG
jgi:hypothetical protein